jgi:hypothetical protein
MTTETTFTILASAPALVRADHDPGSEWPEPARSLRIEARAPERHASRVRCVEWALAQLAIDLVDPEAWSSSGPDAGEARFVDAMDLQGGIELSTGVVDCLRAIAAVELHGSGGRLGLYGGATQRMAWARHLGKGRHHASDGGAWDAAIAWVFGGVDEMTPAPTHVVGALRLLDDDWDWLVRYCIWRSVEAPSSAESIAWTNAALHIIAAELSADPDLAEDYHGLTFRAHGLPIPAGLFERREWLDANLPLQTGRWNDPVTGARSMVGSGLVPNVTLVSRSEVASA